MANKGREYSNKRQAPKSVGEELPPVPKAPKPVAICLSDVHFSHRPPIARSSEEDWYGAMLRPWIQLSDLREKLVKEMDVPLGTPFDDVLPILCAGDIFHRWNPPVELVNFVLRHIPKMFTIPGQHDLPNHSLEGMNKSAYATLVEAGKITDLTLEADRREEFLIVNPFGESAFRVWAFPWGLEIIPNPDPHDLYIDVALIHSYVWMKDKCYPGAPKDKRVGKLKKKLKGYDITIFGDNHKGFMYEPENGPVIFNCGCFMRRNSDEKDYIPQVGVIYSDGSVKSKSICPKEDKIDKLVVLSDQVNDLAMSFLEELQALHGEEVCFEDAIKRALEHVDPSVRMLINKLIDRSRK